MNEERRKALVEGLVGEEHRRDYETSAYFKTHVDVLVELLPFWVSGIAEVSARDDFDARRRMMDAMMRTPVDPRLLEGLVRVKDGTR